MPENDNPRDTNDLHEPADGGAVNEQRAGQDALVNALAAALRELPEDARRRVLDAMNE